MGTGPNPLSPQERAAYVPEPLRLRRTLARAIRSWWDHLGLACALSVAWVAAMATIVGLGAQASAIGAPGGPAAILLATIWGFLLCFVAGAATAGVHRVAYRAIEADDPGLPGFFIRDGALLKQAFGLVLVQVVVSGGLGLNVAFYLGMRSGLGLLLAIVFGYGLLFWLAACLYHWPLLVAGAMGRIVREDGSRPRLPSVFRNAFVLLLAAPAYAAGLGAFLLLVGLPLILSGVGLVLVVPALAAFVTTQAVRDHMVRYGMLAPQDDGPASPDVWSVPK